MKLNFSIFRAGLLICCYLMDRREVDIEEAIAVFNKLAGSEPDPTKDLFRSLEFTIRREVIRVKIRREHKVVFTLGLLQESPER